VAGPFFANMGGFLAGLLTGFPRLNVGAGDPQAWAGELVVLPQGWTAIEVDRVFVRGASMRLAARHGQRAVLQPRSRA